MVLLNKQKIKIVLSIFFIICASIIIYVQMKKPILSVSKLSIDEKNSKLQIKSNLSSQYDVKLYKKTKDEQEFTKVESKQGTMLNKKDTFEINAEDKKSPNNVTNIQTSIIDDYIIISFDEAKDEGTEYEYYLTGSNKDDNIKTEVLKEYSLSGMKGYNYIIDSNPNNQAGFEVNKIDSEPILHKGIRWNQNYYLHIRAIDNNNNFSENITYKINLPSKGLRMQYIDINSNLEISPEETVIGNANDEYNVNEYNKKIEGYQLINTDGEKVGKLKKERINIKYKYAKDSKVTVRYLNKLTGKEIANRTYIDGYEGKEYNIIPKIIKNYQYSGDNVSGKMTLENNEVNLYYDEVSKINIKYIDYLTGKSIIENASINGVVGSSYETNAKDIAGYDFFKLEGYEKGEFKKDILNVVYYYKAKAKLILKHIDIDTNKELETEVIYGHKGEKLTIKSKKFEGYILENDNKPEKIQSSNIIDEILQEEYTEKQDDDKNELIEHNFKQYDIVLDCGNNEYIIYYKKK